MKILRCVQPVAGGVAVLALLGAGGLFRMEPSHERAWQSGQERLPQVRIVDDVVRIANVRDFRHHADRESDVRWIETEFRLSDVATVWFVLSPFSPRLEGLAHPFLSFEFTDGRYLAVSVEARKEVGESYSPAKGLLRRYETMVVIGTEQDLLGLRAIAWDDPLYLFPVRIQPEQARTLLTALLDRARQIEERPEFYNTVTNNCTTNLIEPVNRLATRRIGWRVGLLPGYSFQAAYTRGWIDTTLPLDEARRTHYVNERVRAAADDAEFSRVIRRSPRPAP